MKLAGKIAVVTGAGRGIGQEIALALAREGANIVVNDLDRNNAEVAAEEIKGLGRTALPVQADVTSSLDVLNLFGAALGAFGKVDILVNNAGIERITPSIDLTEAEWDRTMAVNLKSQFLCCQAVARHMIERKEGGRIVNIASVAGHAAMPGRLAYGVTKAGIIHLTRILAVEWAKYKIHVNSVSPGATSSPMLQKTLKENPELIQRLMERIPLGNMAEPKDIAAAVVFLCSPESNHVTGQELTVDGGLSVLHPGYVAPKQ